MAVSLLLLLWMIHGTLSSPDQKNQFRTWNKTTMARFEVSKRRLLRVLNEKGE